MEQKTTESASARYRDLDVWESTEAVSALYEAQLAAVAAIGPALGAIATAVDAATMRLKTGAGSSMSAPGPQDASPRRMGQN